MLHKPSSRFNQSLPSSQLEGNKQPVGKDIQSSAAPRRQTKIIHVKYSLIVNMFWLRAIWGFYGPYKVQIINKTKTKQRSVKIYGRI